MYCIMENVIKIPSQQSSFNGTNNLVDIVIPGNSGVYDLSEMYITIDTRLNVATVAGGADKSPGSALDATVAVQNVMMDIRHADLGDSIYDKTACPVEILVRNCSLMSASRGKVEDVRRSDRLRATMKSYLQDLDDVQSAALTNFTPGAAKGNIFALGPHAQLFGEGAVLSKRQTHEVRIYLRDIFEIAKTDAWDSAVYGNTHIHLELNLSDIFCVKIWVIQRMVLRVDWRGPKNTTTPTPLVLPVNHRSHSVNLIQLFMKRVVVLDRPTQQTPCKLG